MAIAETLEALRREPDNEFAYTNLLYLYTDLNRLDEARATYQQALEHKFDKVWLHVGLYGVASLQGDAAEMGRLVALAAGKPGIKDMLLSEQADTEGFYGRLAKAREFSRRAVESAQRAEEKQAAALWQMNAALREAEFGNAAVARKEAAAALALASTRDTQTLGALGKSRDIVTPRVVEVVIQEYRWEQAECEWRARSEALDDLPGAQIFFMGVGSHKVEVELIGVHLSKEFATACELFQVEELVFFEAMNGFDVALVSVRGGGDAHMLTVAESCREIAFELAAVVGLPDPIAQRDSVRVQLLLDTA